MFTKKKKTMASPTCFYWENKWYVVDAYNRPNKIALPDGKILDVSSWDGVRPVIPVIKCLNQETTNLLRGTDIKTLKDRTGIPVAQAICP